MMDVEYDLVELLNGKVDDITARLAELGDDDLPTLHVLEEKGKNRTTLLAAIDVEKARRVEAGGAEMLPSDMVTSEQVGQMLAQKDFERDAEIKALQAAHADEIDKLNQAHQAEIERLGEAGSVAPAPAPPTAINDSNVKTLIFIDDAFDPIPSLPPILCAPSDFEPNGAQVLLIREIEFPVAMAERMVAGAVLIEGDSDSWRDAIGKAMLVQPYAIGGGRQAKLLPRTLSFG